MKVGAIINLYVIFVNTIAYDRNIRQLFYAVKERYNILINIPLGIIAYDDCVFPNQCFRVNQKGQVSWVGVKYYNVLLTFQRPVYLTHQPPACTSGKYLWICQPAFLFKTGLYICVINPLHSRVN